MYELLVQAGKEAPVPGNQNGSYVTMKSNQGLVFGAATIMSGFSGVFCDQGMYHMCANSLPLISETPCLGYWQRVCNPMQLSCLAYVHIFQGYRKRTSIDNKSLCELICHVLRGFTLRFRVRRCLGDFRGSPYHGRSRLASGWRLVHS